MPAKSSSRKPYRVGRSKTGLGLFAVEPIKKRAFIAAYVGRKVPTKTADDLNNKYLFEVNTRWTIDGSPRRNIARYINHSCRPNAEPNIVRGVIKINAIRNIKPGEEITYNYGRNYFTTFIKPVGCKCAACMRKRARLRAEGRAKAKRAAKRAAAKRAQKKS